MADDKNGNKVYWKIFVAFKFLFINKTINNLIEYVPILEQKENVVFYKINAKDLTLNTQSERNIPIQKLSKIFKLINMDFEIIKVEVPYNFEKQINNLSNLKELNKDKSKLNQFLNYKNELKNLENSISLKSNFYLIIYGKDNKTLSNK